MSLLEVEDLTVTFRTDDGPVVPVRGLSFTLEAGSALGVVGESGSGKSVSAQTIMGLTRGASIQGRVRFDGRDVLTLAEREWRRLRGREIAMIFQDPLTSLHPHFSVGAQIVEAIRAHTDDSKAVAKRRAVDLLGQVGIAHASKRAGDYPHTFSGGMRQRVMIAMALALRPRLIIADEPTTALDVTVQAEILDLLADLQQQVDAALILITHDLSVVSQVADRVLIMYAGTAVEQLSPHELQLRPHHPYTQGLLSSSPSVAMGARRLTPIPGSPPSLLAVPPGCSFHPRCASVMDRCRAEQPTLEPVGDSASHRSACFLPPVAHHAPAEPAGRL